jgi:hypothetical protein
VCDFSISHYFAELDLVHVPLTLVAECLQRALRRIGCGRLPSDHHTVTVEGAPDFPLRLPNVALRQNRSLRFVKLRRSRDP